MEGRPSYSTFEVRVQSEHLVYLDSESFKKTAFEYRNPGAVGAFCFLSNTDLTPTIYIDTELFRQPGSDGESYEDILPFVLEHEIRELYANTQDRLDVPAEERQSGYEGKHDEPAAIASMKSAFQAGKLDKYLEFLEKVQYLATVQEIEYWSEKGYAVTPSSPHDYIQRNRKLAEQVRNLSF